MSYALTLQFVKTPMRTEGDALKFASDFVKRMTNTPEFANEQITQHLYAVCNRLQDIGFKGQDKEALLHATGVQSALDAAMHDIFSMRCLYWPQHQLMAILYGALPPSLADQVTEVCFQNSTDQDYPFEEWSDEIPLFRQEKQSVLTLSAQEIRREMTWVTGIGEEKDEYARRSLLYRRIYDKLMLDNYLYRTEEEPDFTTFRVSGVGNSFQQTELRLRMRAAVYRELQKDPQFLL